VLDFHTSFHLPLLR